MAVPLVFVVFTSMFKDAYEDLMRHQDDNKENNTKTLVLNQQTGKFEEKPWHSVRVGQIVKVLENGFFPADMVLISASDPEGTIYVETKNLDGETNLKTKNVTKDL